MMYERYNWKKGEVVTAEKLNHIERGVAGPRVVSLDDTALAIGTVIEAVGVPAYVNDVSEFSEYGITETGWYIFARISAEPGVRVDESTRIEGAAGYIALTGEDYIDVAVRFAVAAVSQKVTIDWGAYVDTFIFKAGDLAVRNLDYQVTFYVYDIDPFATWEYALTTDETFIQGKTYYTKDGDEYTEAEVTVGEAVPADTYYVHSKVIFEGMTKNITYRFNHIVDCPIEFILPEIEDDCHGAWFEIRFRHDGEYSVTLVPPSADVKIATEHTQKETAGINMVDLHYSSVGGAKVWRFMNTHSSFTA